jgi:DNA-binding NarL/FixJ family response regulator
MRTPQWVAILGIAMTLRLLIVDDNAHFLVAARCLLKSEGIDVVGVASTTDDALRYVRSLRPDVTLVDVDLGEESGFDLAATLTDAARGEGQRVILISAYPEQDLAELIEASPAVGFVPKTELSASAIFALLQPAGDIVTD